MKITKVSKEVRTALHAAAGIRDRYVPVEIVPDADIEPRVVGTHWHYVYARYLMAHGWKCKPQYVASTYRLQVGEGWIKKATGTASRG